MTRNNKLHLYTFSFTVVALAATCCFAQMPPRPPIAGADAPGIASVAAKPEKPASAAPATPSPPASATVSAASAPVAALPTGNRVEQQRSKDPWSAEYTQLQKEEALWEKRAKIADLKKKAAGWDQPISSTPNLNGPLPGAMPTNAVPSVPAPAPAATVAPARKSSRLDTLALTGLTTFNGKHSAVVSVDGSPIDVNVGTPLVDGWVVAEITDSAVKLVNGKQQPHWLRK